MKNTGKKAPALISIPKQAAQKNDNKKQQYPEGFNLRTDVFNFLGIFMTKQPQVLLAQNSIEECAV